MKFKTVNINISLGWNNTGNTHYRTNVFILVLYFDYLVHELMKMIVMLTIFQDAKMYTRDIESYHSG